jgi:hypothetical protein
MVKKPRERQANREAEEQAAAAAAAAVQQRRQQQQQQQHQKRLDPLDGLWWRSHTTTGERRPMHVTRSSASSRLPYRAKVTFRRKDLFLGTGCDARALGKLAQAVAAYIEACDSASEEAALPALSAALSAAALSSGGVQLCKRARSVDHLMAFKSSAMGM